MLEHFKIIGLNELNEPFNSTNILDTPKYVNQNEQVFFSYATTTGLTLKGDEKWVWDFDYGQTVTDQVKQTIYGFNEPIPVVFAREGNRTVGVEVYEQIQKRSLKISTNKQLNIDTPISYVNNPSTNNTIILTDNKLVIINSLDEIEKTITLTDKPLQGVYVPQNQKIYIITDNSYTIVLDANNETLLTTINTSGNLTGITLSNDYIYTSVDDTQCRLDIINIYTDNIDLSIDVENNPLSLTYSIKHDKLFLVNTDYLTVINASNNNMSIYPVNTNPFYLQIDEINDNVYIRTDEYLEIFDINTNTIQSFNVGLLSTYNNALQYNPTLDELYILTDTNVKTLYIKDLTFTKELDDVKNIYYDNDSLVLYCAFTNDVKLIESATFDAQHTINISTINIFKTIQGKILFGSTNKVYILNIFSNETNIKVDGKLLYSDTVTFDVYKFPTIIEGLEYATDTQVLTYTTNANDAQYYEWYVNGVKQLSTINSMDYTFINVVKALIVVNVINGRTIKQLSFTTKLSQGSAVIGKKYDGNVKDSLLFFNKEGDNLNFEQVTDENGLTHWEGDMIFHVNSNDTFKTIGLYTLEKVNPLKFTTEDLYLRKLQMFNEFGIDFQQSKNDFYIESIQTVNKQNDYYTKWLFAPNIHNIPIGTEIILKDIYTIEVVNNVLVSDSLIEELNSEGTNGFDLFTVVGNKRNAIMVISKTNNSVYNKNYGYGDFRLSNNTIKKVPQGKIEIKNIIKVYKPTDYSFDWNEPFYKDLFYERKKINLLNTQLNDGIYTVGYKDYNDKLVKINSIHIDDLIEDVSLGFQVRLKIKTSKIILSSYIPVDFLPISSNPFLNKRNLLVWESILERDFTPALLKNNLTFRFEQTNPSVNNFDKQYKSNKIDKAINILTPQTTDEQDYKLILNNYDKLKDYTFTFTINKTVVAIKEGVNWNRGFTLNDSAYSIAVYLNNVLGLSVLSINNEVWIHEKQNYTLILKTKLDNSVFYFNKGVLKENNPTYGIVGDEWVLLGDNYKGYIHHRIAQNNFHILYDTWYTLPTDKKVVWVDVENMEYLENSVTEVYLEENELYFTQKGDVNSVANTLIETFILDNTNTLYSYGIDVYSQNNTLNLARTYSLKDNEDYIDIDFYINGIASTKGYVQSYEIQCFDVIETLKDEKNSVYGKNKRLDKVSELYERRIIIKDIDKSFGFVLTINGINYDVTADDLTLNSVIGLYDEIIDVEETLTDWGNQKFRLAQDITPDDTSDIGKPYYRILEELGVLVWLDKSEESFVQDLPRFDTIVIQSRFPNNTISYSVNGTLDQHKIIHSDVLFYGIESLLSITVNRVAYEVKNQGSIQSTLENWVETWSATLLEQDIIVEYLSPKYGSGFYGGSIYDKLRFSTLYENTNIAYSVWVGKNNIIGNPFYEIKSYRKGKQGIILSGNEVRINTIDLQDIGFATGMITTLTGSKFPMNNQEYNLIFVDSNILGLSYQGTFWNNNDSLDYHKTRSGFDWELYNENVYEENPLNGVYVSTAGLTSIITTTNPFYLKYEPINDYMWVSHTNDIYVLENETIIHIINLGMNINYMKYNQVNRKMYVSNTNSNIVNVIDTDTFEVIKTIYTDVSPYYSEIDPYTGYVYVVNQDNDNVHIIDGITHNILKSVVLDDKPTKIVFDYHSKKMFIINELSGTVSALSTQTNDLLQNIVVGTTPIDIIYDDVYKEIYVTCNEGVYVINTTTLVPTLISMVNPRNMEFIKIDKNIYVLTDTDLIIMQNRVIKDSLALPYIPNNIKYIPFSRTLFIASDNNVVVVKIDDDGFHNIETIFDITNALYIDYSNDRVFITSDDVKMIEQVASISEVVTVIETNSILSLSSREFLRYPRERYDSEKPIQFKLSWEDNDALLPNTDIFFYDFSGEQLFIEQNGKRINDKGIYNYNGVKPLLDKDDVGYLIKDYNNDLKETTNPIKQQTIWNELYYDLNLIDSEDDIDFHPLPIQTFIGYNSKEEGVDTRILLIERLENIELKITTKLKDDNDVSLGWKDILNFKNNEITTQNSTINFIQEGFIKGQIIEIKGKDIVSTKNQATFKNAGFIGIIENVMVNKLILKPLNKDMVEESSLTTTRSIIPPFNIKETAFEIVLTVLPTKIARITIKGQTEIEDERFKVELNNKGYNINHRDVFIFDDYDIKENGIDWVYLNEKRKEMLTMYPEIYNYLGSYKALVNAINYFGYEDIELYEYYLNIDKESRFFNKLHKIEIPDIFNNKIEGYKPNDFILKTLPNNRYQKTKLFNLTYRITDLDGNNIIAFSLDEVITKLLGLKKWLREHIMPVGTRIMDITGRGDTPHTVQIWHDVKFSTKFKIHEDLTIVDYELEGYQQPVQNHSKTYNIHVKFKVNGTMPDYYQVNVKTFSKKPNAKLRTVQNHSWYKTDLESINFTADRYTDPYILIETIQDNGYGATYTNKKTYLLNKFGNLSLEI